MGKALVLTLLTPAVLGAAHPAVSRSACADFNAYKHGQMLPPTVAVGAFTVSSFPANPIRIYDPVQDGGPEGAIGATIHGRLDFASRSGRYSALRLWFVSDNPTPTQLTIVDRRGVVLRRATLPAKPQNTLLSHTEGNLRSASGFMVDNGAGETMISRACLS